MRAKTSTAKNPCRTPLPRASRWPLLSRRLAVSCRSDLNASARSFTPRRRNLFPRGRLGTCAWWRARWDAMIPPVRGSIPTDGSFAADAGLGHMAGQRAEEAIWQAGLCPLALLEGVWNWGGRRSAGSPGQRNDVRTQLERASQAGHGDGRHSALEGWTEHARCPHLAFPVWRHPSHDAVKSGYRVARSAAHHGIERIPGDHGIRAHALSATRSRHLPQLLRAELPKSDAGGVLEAMARTKRSQAGPGTVGGSNHLQEYFV